MPTITQVIDDLQNLTYSKVTQSDIARVLGVTRATISTRVKSDSLITAEERKKLEQNYNVELGQSEKKPINIDDLRAQITEIKQVLKMQQTPVVTDNDVVAITYYPNVYLSAGYGIETTDEQAQTMFIDRLLLVSEHGVKTNPKNCEIVRVSGNSMEPEYRHGDRVIIDRADTQLLDGHIYAIRYKGQCYVKEINLLPNEINCISLNPKYKPFTIDMAEDFKVLGRIIPRVRL